ncbi:hypothetical protein CsSME_00042061 [Camellia sinensis var. sinensis]
MRLQFTNIAYKLFDKMSKKNNYAHTNTYEDSHMYYSFAGQLFAKSFESDKLLKKIGLGKEDHHFWKQVGTALLCTYTLFGVAWLYNETSPLGLWTLKPKPKEERELAHLYERRNTAIGPKGVIELDKDSYNYQKELQDKKFEQEALQLRIRMRN